VSTQAVLITAACSLVLAVPWPFAVAQSDPIQKAGPGADQYGDPLPAHALMRIGTTRLRPNVDNGGRIEAMAFTKDGNRLVTTSEHTEVWDAVTGKRVLASGNPASLSLAGVTYDLPDATRAAIFKSEKYFCRCFSPDGKGIFTGSGGGRVRLWDVVSGKLKREFTGFDTTILALAVSPDGKRVAASCIDETLRMWDVDSGKELLDFEGHRMHNVQARFGSDGKTIVSICGFNPTPYRTADERTYRIWDATTGTPLKRVELSREEFLPFCLSGDANVLFVIDAGKITKANLSSGKSEEVRGLPANYAQYQCSSDGRYLAGHTEDWWDKDEHDLVGNTLRVVDTTTAKEVLAIEGRKGEAFHCRFTADGRYLSVNSFRYEKYDDKGCCLKQSFLRIWDMRTGRETSEGNLLERKRNEDCRWPGGVSLSPDRTLALTRGKDFVELCDLKTNAKLAQFQAGESECESWAFSRGGKVIALGDQKGRILLWSVSARNPLGTLEGHEAAVTSVQFSADGKKLLSGSDDTTIVLWNIAQWTAPAATSR
jgi:WD40 repeat protein